MFQAYFAHKFYHAKYFPALSIPKLENLRELSVFKSAYAAQEFPNNISVWNSLT